MMQKRQYDKLAYRYESISRFFAAYYFLVKYSEILPIVFDTYLSSDFHFEPLLFLSTVILVIVLLTVSEPVLRNDFLIF